MNKSIAIIGISGMFSGAGCVKTYWENILNKVDNIQEAPDNWVGNCFDPNSTEFDKIYTKKVGLLGELAEFNPLEFGIPPTSIPATEPDHFLALKMARDALFDAGYESKPFNREKTGVILGRGATPNRGSVTGVQHTVIVDQTLELLSQLLPQLDAETLNNIRVELKSSLPPLPKEALPGLVSNVAVGRIANRLDLRGPSYMVDAACSSSLIAVELAMKELRSGNCELMLAGGVQGSMPPLIYMLFCQLNALSRSNIRPFDAAANGTLLAEGAGFLVLKPVEKAREDGDRIYAVLKEVGLSSDGKALGLLAPRLEGEMMALQRAYTTANISPDTVSLIEAHGTGIPLGDKTEINALTEVFGERKGKVPPCALGSVKSMIGHAIPAAGIASLIKITLALYHKILPPTLCDTVNPELEIEKTPFYINNITRPWIHGSLEHPRRSGVNAFGFGGINAHAILEEYPGEMVSPANKDKQLHSFWPSELFVFAAESKQDLLKLIETWGLNPKLPPETQTWGLNPKLPPETQTWGLNPKLPPETQTWGLNPKLLQECNSFADLAFTNWQEFTEVTKANYRLAIVATDIKDLQKKLTQVYEKISQTNKESLQTRNGIYYSVGAKNEQKIAFLFPGEGSQYPQMLADLCLYFPQVRSWFDLSDRTFSGVWEYPPSTFIFPPPTGVTAAETEFLSAGLYSIDVATETIFTAGMALYELLTEFGIKSDVMVGHSTGEYTALFASGTIKVTTAEEMIAIKRNLNKIYKEVEAQSTLPRGALLSVGAVDESKLNSLLEKAAGKIYLAMDNCPNQKVLYGSKIEIEKAAEEIKAMGGICQELPFDRGYHTPEFGEMGEILLKYYENFPIVAPQITLYSCATTAAFPQTENAIRELVALQWSNTVKFRETIEQLYTEGVGTFIEVGPSSNLTSFVNDILGKKQYQAIASNNQRKPGLEQLQHLLARLFVQGMTVDFSPLYQYREVKEINFNAPATESNKTPVLDLTLPKITLKPEFVNQIKDQLSFYEKAPFSSDGSELGDESSLDNQVTSQPTPEMPQNTAPETPKMIAETNPKISEDDRLSILSAHFELMQDFLGNQERVTEAFFDKSNQEFLDDKEWKNHNSN